MCVIMRAKIYFHVYVYNGITYIYVTHKYLICKNVSPPRNICALRENRRIPRGFPARTCDSVIIAKIVSVNDSDKILNMLKLLRM